MSKVENTIKLSFGPMEGVTTAPYRRLHAQFFGAADDYYTPFFSPTMDHLFTPRELNELRPEQNEGLNVVPQILTKSAEDFLWAAQGLAEMGYSVVNLNLGCPSATVTAKGKGSGLLRTPDKLRELLDGIYAKTPIPVSLKTRIGFSEPEEWQKLLDIYNQYPVAELIVHPRTREEYYGGEPHRELYQKIVDVSQARVCYNGNILSKEDLDDFIQTYPQENHIMCARGAAMNPALFRQIRGGGAATREELQAFHQAVYETYKALYGVVNGMHRTKEVWNYLIFLFEDADGKITRTFRRTKSVMEFEQAVQMVFANLPLKNKISHIGEWK